MTMQQELLLSYVLFSPHIHDSIHFCCFEYYIITPLRPRQSLSPTHALDRSANETSLPLPIRCAGHSTHIRSPKALQLTASKPFTVPKEDSLLCAASRYLLSRGPKREQSGPRHPLLWRRGPPRGHSDTLPLCAEYYNRGSSSRRLATAVRSMLPPSALRCATAVTQVRRSAAPSWV